MDALIKIRDVSVKYDISARTLRYYEDMGLMNSTRSDDYAYRMYDESAVRKLEQILILRKLNISIKDIQRIFSATIEGAMTSRTADDTERVERVLRTFQSGKISWVQIVDRYQAPDGAIYSLAKVDLDRL